MRHTSVGRHKERGVVDTTRHLWVVLWRYGRGRRLLVPIQIYRPVSVHNIAVGMAVASLRADYGFRYYQIERGKHWSLSLWRTYSQEVKYERMDGPVTTTWGELDYNHKVILIQGDHSRTDQHLPMIHIVFGNLDAWLLGTHHGVSPKHLQGYLNEFVFRFNRRYWPLVAFDSVLNIAARVTSPTYEELYKET
jgi:hypothetical protein